MAQPDASPGMGLGAADIAAAAAWFEANMLLPAAGAAEAGPRWRTARCVEEFRALLASWRAGAVTAEFVAACTSFNRRWASSAVCRALQANRLAPYLASLSRPAPAAAVPPAPASDEPPASLSDTQVDDAVAHFERKILLPATPAARTDVTAAAADVAAAAAEAAAAERAACVAEFRGIAASWRAGGGGGGELLHWCNEFNSRWSRSPLMGVSATVAGLCRPLHTQKLANSFTGLLRAPPRRKMELDVPPRCRRALIGVGGSIFRELRDTFHTVRFHVPGPDAADAPVTVDGPVADCEAAAAEVLRIVGEETRRWEQGARERWWCCASSAARRDELRRRNICINFARGMCGAAGGAAAGAAAGCPRQHPVMVRFDDGEVWVMRGGRLCAAASNSDDASACSAALPGGAGAVPQAEPPPRPSPLPPPADSLPAAGEARGTGQDEAGGASGSAAPRWEDVFAAALATPLSAAASPGHASTAPSPAPLTPPGGARPTAPPLQPASPPVPAAAAAEGVRAFLAHHNLGQFADALVAEGYDDIATLCEVSDGELCGAEIGMRAGHMRRLRRVLPAAPPPAPAPR